MAKKPKRWMQKAAAEKKDAKSEPGKEAVPEKVTRKKAPIYRS